MIVVDVARKENLEVLRERIKFLEDYLARGVGSDGALAHRRDEHRALLWAVKLLERMTNERR